MPVVKVAQEEFAVLTKFIGPLSRRRSITGGALAVPSQAILLDQLRQNIAEFMPGEEPQATREIARQLSLQWERTAFHPKASLVGKAYPVVVSLALLDWSVQLPSRFPIMWEQGLVLSALKRLKAADWQSHAEVASLTFVSGGFWSPPVTYCLDFAAGRWGIEPPHKGSRRLSSNPLKWPQLRLSDHDRRDLQRQLAALHLEYWDKTYLDPDVYDGEQWQVKVCYVDGTVKEFSGSNAYPLNFRQFRQLCRQIADY